MQDNPFSLAYDWTGGENELTLAAEISDESLRDGLQSPSIRQPDIEERVDLLHLMTGLGIEVADIGMPASGDTSFQATLALAKAAAEEGLAIRLNCAARTVVGDVRPIVEISEQAGIAIEVMAFIGSSPIRLRAEGWSVEGMLQSVRESVRFAVGHGLPTCLVTEDSTRARPEFLKLLYTTALDEGATRVCVADTVGSATPAGARRLVEFIKIDVLGQYAGVPLDWHGHNDRGLALANTLAAIDGGADRVHGTALGIGERCGNTAMEQILVNLNMLGAGRELRTLPEYCRQAAKMFDRPIAANDPIVGRDAFRTASGVHAAAIAKARLNGDDWISESVYSNLPASSLGLAQQIDIGPLSGRSNVMHWLRGHGLTEDPLLVDLILQTARSAERLLSEADLLTLARQ